MRNKMPILVFLIASLMCIMVFSTAVLADDKPGPIKPKRLASIGDSITAAVDAEVIMLGSMPYLGEQPWASWVNGRYGFLQWFFGLTNPKSHNQRITRKYGWWGRRNYMFAEPGATSEDFVGQAIKAVNRRATYVTVFLGNNDACVENLDDLSTADDFTDNMRAGLQILATGNDGTNFANYLGLPRGATIYVIGLPDISQLFGTIAPIAAGGQGKKALGLLPCVDLWSLAASSPEAWPDPLDWPSEGEPWETIANILLTINMNPSDFIELVGLLPSFCAQLLLDYIANGRDALSGRIQIFNGILESLVAQFNNNDSNHHYYYTSAVYDHSRENANGIPATEVSDIDCYHPSGAGERKISKDTWADIVGVFPSRSYWHW